MIIRSYMLLSLTWLSLFQLTFPPSVIAANTASLLPSLAAFHNFKFKSLLLTVDISDKDRTCNLKQIRSKSSYVKRLLYSTRFPPTGITVEGLWKPKNDAKSEFYPGFSSKIQNSRAWVLLNGRNLLNDPICVFSETLWRKMYVL